VAEPGDPSLYSDLQLCTGQVAECRVHALLGLVELASLGAQGRGGGFGEVASKSRLKERSEDDLSTVEGRKRKPKEKDKLENKVEGKPVDNVDEALQDGEEGKHHPVSQPLRVILSVGGEQSLQGVVSRDDEACKVSEELAAEVEDDEEEVESGQSNGSVGFGHARLLLYVVQGGVLGKLLVNVGKIGLRLFLCGRHGERFCGVATEGVFRSANSCCARS